MRVSKYALGMALLSALAGGRATAQQFQTLGLSQPASVTQTAYDANNYDYYSEAETNAASSETNAAEAAERLDSAAGSCCNSCGNCCGNGCNGCCSNGCCGNGCCCGAAAGGATLLGPPPADPNRLFGNFKPLGTNFYGWMAAGYAWNFDDPADRFNGPVTWPDRSNEFQLNEMYMVAERPTNTDGYGFDMGYRVDALYGTNSRFNTSAGLEDRINKSDSFYGLALPNMYAEVALNKLKVKVGHYTCPVGYFGVGTYNNFFNVLPYTFQYGEPFTHTGFLAIYPLSERLTLHSGMTRGWDNSGSFNPSLGVINMLVYTSEKKQTVSFFTHWSQEPNLGAPRAGGEPAFSPRYIQSAVYQQPLGEHMSYVIQSDFGMQARALADGRIAHWYGVNQYLYYTKSADSKVQWGINGEWFRDEDGFRVGGFLPNFPNNTNGGPTETRGLPTNRSGYAGNFYRVMVGPRLAVTKNLLIRPSLVFDWFDGEARNAGGLRPFDDGSDNNQQMLATDAVIVF